MAKGKKLLSKGRYELQFRGTECRNCGFLLDKSDKYCPNCSQINSTKKLTLKDFVHEFLSSVINYDSKLFRTLYAMLLKPGTITRDYINGKRVSYTNPFRFLLSLAFVYFLMVNYGGNFSSLDNLNLDRRLKERSELSFDLASGKVVNDSISLDTITTNAINQLDSLGTVGNVSLYRPNYIDSLKTFAHETTRKERKQDSLKLANPTAFFRELQKNNAPNIYEKMAFFYTYLQRDSIRTFKEAQDKFGVRPTFSNKVAFRGTKSFLRSVAQPRDFINTTIAKLPLVIFFFLPLFAVFIFLAYIRKKYTYTDHLIFSFHNQSLLFILLIISWVIDIIFGIGTLPIAFALFSIYLFQAMRNFYGQSVLKTIIKYAFLNSAFLFLAFICAILLFTGSIITF